jgi:hypothetical protein
MAAGGTGEYHFDMAQRCGEDAEDITNAILASGVTVEQQAEIVRRQDLEAAQRIIDRHVIFHGVGIPADKVPAARMAMARDIADAMQAARRGAAQRGIWLYAFAARQASLSKPEQTSGLIVGSMTEFDLAVPAAGLGRKEAI